MKTSLLFAGMMAWILGTMAPHSPAAAEPALEAVASFPNQQVTGVTLSRAGRLFVSFPFWSDDHTTSVAEMTADGAERPYPDLGWNSKEGPPESRWICVQSVYVDDKDMLWVLDPASPKMEGVVRGGPKLVEIDLATGMAARRIPFNDAIAPEHSYLNDVRVDAAAGVAYITDSGMGAIVVVNLGSGVARRVLARHPSTKAEPGATIVVEGMNLIDPKTGQAPVIHSDGIALDRSAGWLYYHALSGHGLYRVKTADLRNEALTEPQLGALVEKLGDTPKPDGMLEGRDGTLYLTAIEKNAIVRFDVATKKSTVIIEDKRLQWPDTMTWGPDGDLYVTTSQIHRTAKYHGGKNFQDGPFRVYRLKLPTDNRTTFTVPPPL